MSIEPSPPSGAAVRAPLEVPPDVRCRWHFGSPAAAICTLCGDLICTLCTVPVEGYPYCASCSVKVRPSALPTGVPWEQRREIGFFRALYRTVRMMMFEPRAFFRALPPKGNILDPLLFTLVVRGTSLVIAQLALGALMVLLMLASSAPEMAVFQAAVQLIYIPFYIAGVLFMAFALSGLIHLVLLLMTPKHGWETTFRIYCYVSAVDVLWLIPSIGTLIALPWSVYLRTIGFQEIHEISIGRALIASLAPFLLYVFIALAAVGMVVVIMLMVGI